MASPLSVIALERSTQLRARLLELWIHQYSHKVWYWDGTAEMWFQRWELDRPSRMTEAESEMYDQLAKETSIALLLGLESIPEDLAVTEPVDTPDIF